MLAFHGGRNPSIRRDDDLTTPIRWPAGGIFCSETLDLPAGPHTVRLQLQLSPQASDQTVSLSARLGDTTLDRVELDASRPGAAEAADAVTLCFTLPAPGVVTIEGVASSHAVSTHLRFVTQAPVPGYDGHEARFRFHPEPDLGALPIKNVIFGTTAVCNANCFHCPTNKAYSRTQARGSMDQGLFERIVVELADRGFKGGVVFGLFGEPLQDPLFLQRMRFIRQTLPDAILTLSTNGALYDSDKHREALAMADDVAVHIEAVSPEVYAASMKPLKAARTFPRVERLIADREGRRVHVVSPVHRRNLEEVAPLREKWESQGADGTVFAFLMNRAGQADAFDDVALAPVATGCGPEILSDLVVDWDGTVLACCQDFHRRTIIGDLSVQSLQQVLASDARQRVYGAFNDKRWNAIETCAGCKNDCAHTIDSLVVERLVEGDAARRFVARAFQHKGAVTAAAGVLHIATRRSLSGRLRRPFAPKSRAVIFGPYKALFPARYRLRYDLQNISASWRGHILLEVVMDGRVLASRSFPAPREGQAFELEADIPDHQPLEFRLRASGADFQFHGVSSTRLSLGPPLTAS